MTDDEQTFLSRIATEPAEDHHRLVYADWLEENAVTATCTRCDGSGEIMDWVGCPKCDGGRASDGRRERAEFVRVQFRIDAARSITEMRLADFKREKELLAAHETEWRRAGVCSKCDGKPGLYANGSPRGIACRACWGSGDVGGLLRRHPVTGAFDAVDFARGFPHRVHCRLEDVCHEVEERFRTYAADQWGPAEYDTVKVWKPTPWALAVVRHHPVVEFRVDVPFAPRAIANAWHRSELPGFLFDLIDGHDSSTPDAAHTAMAVALGKWVRNVAHPSRPPGGAA